MNVDNAVSAPSGGATHAPARTEPVTFYSGGHRLSAVVYRPGGDASEGPRPAVVLCNGMRGVKEWIVPPFGEIFAAHGYTAIAFDHRGLGSSEGPQGRVIPAEQVEDVRNAVTYLSTLPDVDPERIVLWGTSFGGANAVCAAAVDQRVKAVATQVAFGDWGRVMRATLPPDKYDALVAEYEADRAERVATGVSRHVSPDRMLDNDESRAAKARSTREGVGERPELTFPLESIERCFEYRPELMAAQVAPRPLLVVGSANDMVVPYSECESLYEHAQEPKKLVGMTIGHYAICEPPGSDDAAKIALDFFAPVVFGHDDRT